MASYNDLTEEEKNFFLRYIIKYVGIWILVTGIMIFVLLYINNTNPVLWWGAGFLSSTTLRWRPKE